jgi:hypothetical protein
LTNFYFSISPNEYAKNLLDEEWGCFKHIGMSWDMIMRLPIQDRRALIHKHNKEQEVINNELEGKKSSNERTYEGASLNTFAKMEQSNIKRGGY